MQFTNNSVRKESLSSNTVPINLSLFLIKINFSFHNRNRIYQPISTSFLINESTSINQSVVYFCFVLK